MHVTAIVRYRRPLEEVVVHQEPHRACPRDLKAQGTLLASGPQDPRYGFLPRVPDERPQAALEQVRDGYPYDQAGVARYGLLPWDAIAGREDLDRIGG